MKNDIPMKGRANRTMLLGEPVDRANVRQTRERNLVQKHPIDRGTMLTKGSEGAIATICNRPIEGTVFKVGRKWIKPISKMRGSSD